MDSILTSVKKMLGIAEDYEHFDADIIMHINAVFSVLDQIGYAPEGGFTVTGKDETWSDFMPDGIRQEMCRSYVYLKVRQLFDAPTQGSVSDAVARMTDELEWRLFAAAELTEE